MTAADTAASPAGGHAPDKVRRARVSVSVAFLLFGTSAGLWFVHIPVVAERLALEPATLGLALLMVGLGSILFQPLAGMIVARRGSRATAGLFAPVLLTAMVLPIIAPTVPFLFVATFLLGAAAGAFNVAINTQAAEVEAAWGSPILSTFHGFWSLGGFVAAAIGGFVIASGWGDGRGAIGVALVLLAAKLWATSGCLPPLGDTEPVRHKHHIHLPPAALVGLVGLAFLSVLIEGSVADWSALFLATVKMAPESVAGIGYALFSVAMATVRFAGGAVVRQFGDRAVIVGGGVLVAVGMGIVVGSPSPYVSAFGFLLIGIGAANTAPILISASAHIPGIQPAAGIATVATALASGFLIGPPLIGFVAQGFGLTTALSLVGLVGLVIAAGAAMRTWHERDDKGANVPLARR